MLKKIFKAAMAFTLLVGCYFGYIHVFAVVVQQLTTSRLPDEIPFHEARDSHSKLDSIARAIAVGATFVFVFVVGADL